MSYRRSRPVARSGACGAAAGDVAEDIGGGAPGGVGLSAGGADRFPPPGYGAATTT
ncbi:hypothetical protein GCM10018789_06400 [Streptomyces werraensis]|nr:hypothetical protein GCM10018789_06400 [Streptomyces werraensis]